MIIAIFVVAAEGTLVKLVSIARAIGNFSTYNHTTIPHYLVSY